MDCDHDQPPLLYTKPMTVCIAVTLPIDILECWKTFTIPYLHLVPKGMHIWVSETKKVKLITLHLEIQRTEQEFNWLCWITMHT